MGQSQMYICVSGEWLVVWVGKELQSVGVDVND